MLEESSKDFQPSHSFELSHDSFNTTTSPSLHRTFSDINAACYQLSQPPCSSRSNVRIPQRGLSSASVRAAPHSINNSELSNCTSWPSRALLQKLHHINSDFVMMIHSRSRTPTKLRTAAGNVATESPPPVGQVRNMHFTINI